MTASIKEKGFLTMRMMSWHVNGKNSDVYGG